MRRCGEGGTVKGIFKRSFKCFIDLKNVVLKVANNCMTVASEEVAEPR